MLVGVPCCREQAALGLVAARVEAEVQRDGAARLGAAADVVELETHEGLDQRALAVRLVADDHDRRRHRRTAQLGRQRLQLVVRLVEELPRLPRVRLRRDRRRHWGQSVGGEVGRLVSSTARAPARYLFGFFFLRYILFCTFHLCFLLNRQQVPIDSLDIYS